MTQLILPMAGRSQRFFDAGYKLAKPFIKVGQKPMIDRVLENFPTSWRRIFVLNEAMRSLEPEAQKRLRSADRLAYVNPTLGGPLESVEEALKYCDMDLPVFVSYCDYGLVWDALQFENFVSKSRADVAVVTYRGFHPHYCTPWEYSYVRTVGDLLRTENNCVRTVEDTHPANENINQLRIVDIREKSSFTKDRKNEHASVGGYYFRTATLLKRGLQLQRENCRHWQGEYFTSFAIELLLSSTTEPQLSSFSEPQLSSLSDPPLRHSTTSDKNLNSVKENIGVAAFAYEVPFFFQWGTPQDVWAFEFWENHCKDSVKDLELAVSTLKENCPDYFESWPAQKIYFAKAFAASLNATPL